jgi:hypothetical protein
MRGIARKRNAVAVIGVHLWLAGVASAAAPEVNRQAIEDVRSGKLRVAQAAWWGFDPVESTPSLQAAINSGAEKVIVGKMPGPWIVDKIELAGNQELFFEPGVVVLAKKGAFRGTGDALFTAWGKANIKLTGPGATLQMRRADYDGPDYKKAEWRHVLNFHGCSDVTVEGLTLAESGGDGIYLGAGRRGETNRNVVIRDVICDRNYRQGISVITAENLLIENCVLKGTAGTAPEAGIDFEPNSPTERLVNCVMRKCTIENNQGYALHIYARPLDGTSAPVSIRIEDCVTRGTNARSASVITSCGPSGAVKGRIEFVNCRFEDAGHAGVNIGSKPPGGVKVRFERCTLADPSDKPRPGAPILFSSHPGDLEDIGGVEFVDFTLRERTERALVQFHNSADVRLRDVTGTMIVRRGDRQTEYTLNQKLIDQWFPFDPVSAIRPVALDGLRFEPVGGWSRPAAAQLPAHRLRGETTYLVYAAKGDEVSLRLAYGPVGRYDGKPLPVQVLNPAGKEIQHATIEFRQEGDCKFTADQTGTFKVVCDSGLNTVRMVSCSQPVSVAGNRGAIHLLGTTGDFFFWVPSGNKEFGVRVCGEGEGERISAALFDDRGTKLWEQSNIGTPQSFHARREAAALGSVWRLHLAPPTIGALEDSCVELRGLPSVIGFDAGRVLRPVVATKP